MLKQCRSGLNKLRGQDSNTKDIPVLMISARGRMKYLFSDWEINGFVEKPFATKKLLSKVSDIVGGVKKDKISARKALIIGDDQQAAGLIKVFLQSHGFLVLTISNAAKAIEQAIKIHPDFIFAQAIIEEMDCMQLCHVLRNEPSTKNTPFIVFSDRSAGVRFSSKSGVTKIIEYLNNIELVERIDEFLNKYIEATE